MFLEQTGQYLKESCEDMQVDTAISAKKALQRLKKQEHDVVVSGYKMAKMDGIQFLRELRTRSLKIPFILFTSEGGEEVAVEAFRSGVNDYIVRKGDKKSFHAELARSIRQTIGRMKEEEERYRTLADNMSDYVYMIDEKFRVLSLNRSAAEIFGVKPEEIVGRSIFDLFPKEIATTFQEGLRRVFRRGRSRTIEGRMIVDGRESRISTSLNAVKDREGKTVAVLGVTRDITEKKKIQEALRETEKRLLAVIENLGAGLAIADKEGVLAYVNPDRARLLGYTPEEMIGKPQRSFVHEDSLKIRDTELVKRSRGESSSYEVNLVSKDGKVVPILAIGTPIIDEQGQYAGSYGLTIDLTERKKMEQALLMSEERYRTLVELAHDGIMMTEGPERTISFANRRMEEMLGYTVEELTGKSYLDLVHPDEREETLRNIETDIVSGKGSMYARRLVKKDGSTIDTLISISLVDPSSETTLPRAILIITDITESIRAKEALTQVAGKIQDLEKEVAGLKETYPPSKEQELGKRIEIADLLQLPDHLRGTLIGLSEMREATAGEVAEKTGRVRNIESVYLNQLQRMGLVEKYRKGRRIYFRARSVGGRSVRRVLRQLYGEGR
jgi:PAS domain S-box-containing protein